MKVWKYIDFLSCRVEGEAMYRNVYHFVQLFGGHSAEPVPSLATTDSIRGEEPFHYSHYSFLLFSLGVKANLVKL